MRHKILVVLLTMGMIGGFASGFAHMRHHHNCGPFAHNGEGGRCPWEGDRHGGGTKPALLK